MVETNKIETLRWVGGFDGHLVMIDQTQLPGELIELECRDIDTVFEAIQMLRVRGAPAIGIAGAYGVLIGIQSDFDSVSALKIQLARTCDYLAESRPTAVNLFWALNRMRRTPDEFPTDDVIELKNALLKTAVEIHEEDRQMCHAIGQHGADLLANVDSFLTHCNAGGLATAEYGTALSVFFTCHDRGRKIKVYVDETRPLLQGARLTTWELMQHGIDTTLICDSMAAQVMREGRIEAIVTGADRIARNGDAANKIGTYSLAVLARHHGIPLYIAAPSSTFDLSLPDGDGIPIEERRAEEITHGFGRPTAPEGVHVYNPAFDVTPSDYIEAIITERGVIHEVNEDNVLSVLGIC